MRTLTLAGVDFLRSSRALERLATLGGDSELNELERLRAEGYNPDEAAWLTGQARLRARAATKLPGAGALLLTSEALEQASGLQIARWRAARLRPRERVLDLGAGVGGDTLSLAEAGLQVVAVERDPVRAALLRHNVAALGYGDRVEVREQDWTACDWSGERTAFVDPARRVGGRRVLSLHAMVPPLAELTKLAQTVSGVMVKVAPAVDPYEVPAGVGLEFVSVKGELKEALLTWGELKRAGRPRAILLPGPHVLETDEAEPAARVALPGQAFYEPDPAVLRAGLVRALGARLDAWQLSPTIAYLSADELRPTPFARCFRVLRQGPFGRKPLSKWLRELGAGAVTLKRRGVPIETEALAKRLPKSKGGPRLTVFLTRGPDGPLAVVCEPVPPVG